MQIHAKYERNAEVKNNTEAEWGAYWLLTVSKLILLQLWGFREIRECRDGSRFAQSYMNECIFSPAHVNHLLCLQVQSQNTMNAQVLKFVTVKEILPFISQLSNYFLLGINLFQFSFYFLKQFWKASFLSNCSVMATLIPKSPQSDFLLWSCWFLTRA